MSEPPEFILRLKHLFKQMDSDRVKSPETRRIESTTERMEKVADHTLEGNLEGKEIQSMHTKLQNIPVNPEAHVAVATHNSIIVVESESKDLAQKTAKSNSLSRRMSQNTKYIPPDFILRLKHLFSKQLKTQSNSM